MRDTQRNLANFPSSLETLTNLSDLDLSFNDLPKVPDALYTLPSLRRINLSNNSITELAMALGKSAYVLLFILKSKQGCSKKLYSGKVCHWKNEGSMWKHAAQEHHMFRGTRARYGF